MGRLAFLVPERNSKELELALERLINDQVLRFRLGNQGRQAVLAGFDIHKTSAEMFAIFNEYRKLEQ